jgi:ABC-type transport system involved in multi-copper enzyme maturation permease subunit
MIWKIVKKEFLLNLMTFKFAVGTIVCVVLMAAFMPILAKDYQRRLEDYNANVAANEAELRKVKVYKNITPTVYRLPSALSVFSEGLEKQLSKSAKVELGGVPEISMASGVSNPFLSAFPTLDVMLIVKVVMSILALLVAYDTISGERERGTLRLVLANRTARHEVLLGKLLAGLVTLIIPVTGAFIVGLLILQFFPMVSLSGADWIRIGFMYLASLIFVSAMYNIGLLFSCLMSRSSISLVLGLFVWVVFVVVIPNGSVYLANYLRPTEAREKMAVEVKALMQERNNKIDDLIKTLRTGGQHSMAQGAFGHYYELYCGKPYRDDLQKRYARSEPVRIRYADRIFEVQRQYLSGLTKQKYLASTIAQISPVTVYESLMSALAGTDLANLEHFRNRVKLHTNEVVEYIRSKTKNFSSISYFTPTKEGDHSKMIKEIDRIMSLLRESSGKSHWLEEYRKWEAQKLKQTPSPNLQDLPRFTYGPESLARILRRTISHVMLLFFINVLFFTLSFVAFLKYDVR